MVHSHIAVELWSSLTTYKFITWFIHFEELQDTHVWSDVVKFET